MQRRCCSQRRQGLMPFVQDDNQIVAGIRSMDWEFELEPGPFAKNCLRTGSRARGSSRTQSYPPSANFLIENSPSSDCAKGSRCPNSSPARMIMARELELFEVKQVGRRLTASVQHHQAKSDRFNPLHRSLSDENGFLGNVAGLGASAAIVSDPSRAMHSPSDLALLQVQDTLTALHKLAPSYRQLMPQPSLVVTGFERCSRQGDRALTSRRN